MVDVIITMYLAFCATCAAEKGYEWDESKAFEGGCHKCNKPTMVVQCKQTPETIIQVDGEQIRYKMATTNLE